MTPRTAGWLRVLVVTALIAGACGSPAGNRIAPTTPTSSTNPTPTIAAQQTPCTPANRCLALVTLRGSGSWVVRDVTDIRHASTVSGLGSVGPPRFVSATELSYVDGNSLVKAPLAGSPRSPFASPHWGVSYFDWSPDGTTAAILSTRVTDGQPNTTMELHLATSGNDRTVVSSIPGPPNVYGCESQYCADGWDFHFSYSPDGRFITWAQNVAFVFRMWTAAGADVTPRIPYLYMSTWSGADLYFRDLKDVKVVRNGVASSFLPGVEWIRPKASPSGGQIVYETRDASGVARTFIVDTRTHGVHQLAQVRAEPVYLTSRYIWYRGERACTAADECLPGTSVATGKAYIYDLADSTETESIITNVADVWPHAA